jgi:general transcription factor 3C polypeptide 3 (transcription factor C subunit 4)
MAVYLFRGYEHVQQDPLLCLMIAQAFFGRAMTRQSDNRNYQISQVSWHAKIQCDAAGARGLTGRAWRS